MSGMLITHADAKRALQTAASASARVKHLREKGEAVTEQVVRSLEVSGAAFGLGVVAGSNVFANGEIFKIPLELFAGLGFHALRLLGLGGKHGDHLSNFGDGGLSSYAYTLGRGLGAQHWGTAKTSGEMSGTMANRLAEIANQIV
jgi:hypothetical protein